MVVVRADAREDRFEIDGVVEGVCVCVGDGVYEVVSSRLVGLASELIPLTVDVSLGAGCVVNSLTEGHETVPGKIPVTGTAGSTQLDDSARFLLFPPGAVVSTTSRPADATGAIGGYSDLMVFASSSPVPNIANGKNPKNLPIADMVG